MVEKWVFMCIKNLNNAQLQKENFGQKMTSDNTQQDIFGSLTHIFEISSKQKEIATYNIKLSTTFVLTILFSDNFFCRFEGEEINFLQGFCNAIYTHIETFFIKHYEVLFFPAYT